MNRYLLFRTDRIGDFLISTILLKCIKKNDPLANITVVGSNKNYAYIKSFPNVNNVIKLNNNLFSKIHVFLKLFKFKYQNIIVHDAKNRSKLISFFLRSINKINVINSNQITHIQLIKHILKKMNFEYYEDSLNTLSHIEKKNIINKNLIQLHFDEKWIFSKYINKYINIEPTEIKLINFLKEIIKKGEKKLIITTGFKLPSIMEKIKPELKKLNIPLHENLDFIQLEKITINSNILISCHGAISHVAAACHIKQIDIIDKSYNYAKWTNHFRNYKPLYRDNFDKLSQKILNLL